MRKNITTIIIFVLCLFSLIKVNAFDKQITIGSEGNLVTINDSLQVINSSSDKYPWFHVKNSSSGEIICLSGVNVTVPSPNIVCSLKSSDNYGVAYIINLIKNTTASSDEKYYWTEMLVNGYLGNLEQLDNTSSYFYQAVIDPSKEILSTGLSFKKIIANAKKYNDDVITNPTITVNGNESINLKFTYNSADGYYYSNSVVIKSNVSFNLGNLSNNKFTYKQDGNSYVFKIKQSDIEPGTEESFSNKKEVNSEYMTASSYDCGTGIQKVGLNKVENKKSTDFITIQGSVKREQKNTIIVRKLDEKGINLAGATLLFQTDAQYKTKDGAKYITQENANIFIRNLDAGIYWLSEIETPTGYNKLGKVVKIEIDKDGNVYFDGKKSESQTIDLINTRTKTKFSKISIANQKELPGATLTILDENQEVIVDENGKAIYEWVSGEEPHYIYGLPVGKYYLKEVKSPEGYALSEEIVAFEVKGDGTVTEVIMENALEVKVPDTLSSRSVLLLFIGMIDIALGIGILLYVKKNKVAE